jgi:hypothetical protein
MAKVQTDIRSTSYDAATAKPFGYRGTLDVVLAQIRSEPNVNNGRMARPELLSFLSVDKVKSELSGIQDDSVVYGAPDEPVEPSKYSLEYAIARWPENFFQHKADGYNRGYQDGLGDGSVEQDFAFKDEAFVNAYRQGFADGRVMWRATT